MGQKRFTSHVRIWSAAPRPARRGVILLLLAAFVLAGLMHTVGASAQDVPRPAGHVPELARYFARVQIAAPVVYGTLAIYPVLLEDGGELPGRWLSLDEAMDRGVLLVREIPGGGSVPVVLVRNTSRRHHMLIVTGEILAGGKQARTVRGDVIVAPGQEVKLKVFCVEARRWEGTAEFSAGKTLAPPSVQLSIRAGAMQQEVWQQIEELNRGLAADNPTKSLQRALAAPHVKRKLQEARQMIIPKIPDDAVGYLFVYRGRVRSGEFFGSAHLARALLPKLIEAHVADCVVLGSTQPAKAPRNDDAVIEFFKRVLRAGSHRVDTPGSGAGIRTNANRVLGEGVSLADHVVHYGVQPAKYRILLP